MADKLTHQDTAQAALKLLPKPIRERIEVEDKGGMTNLRASGRIIAACRGDGQVRAFLRLPDHADQAKTAITAAAKAAVEDAEGEADAS